MERKSFVFYSTWLEAIRKLPAEMQGDVLMAIAEYGIKGVEPDSMSPIAAAMLQMAKGQIDANNAKYEGGRAGGAPRGNRNAARDEAANQSYSKQFEATEQPCDDQKQPCDDQKQPCDDQKQPCDDQKQPCDDQKQPCDDIYDICNMIYDNNGGEESRGNAHDPPPPPPGESQETQRPIGKAPFDYRPYVERYNASCEAHHARLPRVIGPLIGGRLSMLKARISEYGQDKVVLAFEKAAASGFLNGHNGTGWVAPGFGWIVRPNNFCKVLEGNYDNAIDNNGVNIKGQNGSADNKRRGAEITARSADDYASTF